METTDNGSEIINEMVGERRVGQGISAFVEVLTDETVEGADRLLEAIGWLKEQVEKKKSQYLEPKRKKRVRSKA
ncbi:MAG TPA: hypothetical protein VFI31_22590 [Pirellulales bacterium]|nr:hypothetical protein [Pirellulales bacterium]